MNFYPISDITPTCDTMCHSDFWHENLEKTNTCPICMDTYLENIKINKFEIIDDRMIYIVRCVCHCCQIIFNKTYTCGGSCIIQELDDDYFDEFDIDGN